MKVIGSRRCVCIQCADDSAPRVLYRRKSMINAETRTHNIIAAYNEPERDFSLKKKKKTSVQDNPGDRCTLLGLFLPPNTQGKNEYLPDVQSRSMEETRQNLNNATSLSLDNVIEDDNDSYEIFL